MNGFRTESEIRAQFEAAVKGRDSFTTSTMHPSHLLKVDGYGPVPFSTINAWLRRGWCVRVDNTHFEVPDAS